MIKLIIFFRKPADDAAIDAFEEHFSYRHVPLIAAMPNVVRSAVSRAIGAPRGEAPYYLIHEIYFADMAALNFALNSAEGRAAGADLSVFARDIVSLMYAEVWGEDPFEMALANGNIGSEPMPTDETSEQLVAGAVGVGSVGGVNSVEGVVEAQDSSDATQSEPETKPTPALASEEPEALPAPDPAPRDIMAELEKDLAPYRKVPIDVSFLENPPSAAPTPESTQDSSITESKLPMATSIDTQASEADVEAPRPPRPSLGETLA